MSPPSEGMENPRSSVSTSLRTETAYFENRYCTHGLLPLNESAFYPMQSQISVKLFELQSSARMPLSGFEPEMGSIGEV
jgi:hypothetical protein